MDAPNPVSTPDWLLEQAHRQRLFDVAGIGSWVRSADGLQAIWSPGLKSLFGFPLDAEPCFEEVLARIPDTYRATIADVVRIGRETGEAFSAEYPVRRPDGSERWVEATAQWFRDANGMPLYVQGVARDITRRRQDEELLLDRERRMQALVDSSTDMFFRLSADFTVLKQLVARDVLSELEAPSAQWLTRYVIAEDRALVASVMAEAVRDAKPLKVECRVSRKDGSVGWIESRATPILSPEGLVEEWVGMATDITESRRLRVALRAQQADLEALVLARTRQLNEAARANERLASRLELACRAVGLGTWYFSVPEHVASWDARMYELFGLLRGEGDSSPPVSAWFRRIHAEDRRLFLRTRRSGHASRMPRNLDFRVVLPDGAIRFLHVTSLVDCDEKGKPIRVVGACEDFTADRLAALELQQAKEAADAANLAKSKFIAAASHDLRQPLAAANLYLDILTDSVSSGTAASLVRRIRGATDSLAKMLESLLDVARLDSSAVQVREDVMTLRQAMDWIWEEFAEQFRVKGLQLRLHFGDRDLRLRTDEILLKGILRNLLVNALKYTDHGGVLVALRLRPASVVFQVWDTGIGIAPDQIPHVFEEFYRIDNAARDLAQGAGLGLSIVLRGATLLDGSVSCRSRPGRGSVFELVLPRDRVLQPDATRAGTVGEARRLPLDRLAGRMVCLVEDDASVREALSLLLATWGMRVLSFAAAAAALASPEIASAEFLITDFRLPDGINGFDLLQELEHRGIRPKRSLVLTGELDLPESGSPSTGHWPVLRKPCDPRRLWKALAD